MAHRTVTGYISVYKAHKEKKLKGVTSLIEAYNRLSESTTRTRKSTPKYDVQPVPREKATEWLNSLTQISGTLSIKVETASQALLALKQGLKQHQNAVEMGKRLVVFFEVGPEVEISDAPVPEKMKAKLPEQVETNLTAAAA